VKSDLLMTWRFPDAPAKLKSLHCGPEIPEWLVLVPSAMSGPDLHEAIMGRSKPGQVARYETPDGDIVYVGTSELDSLTRPSSMAAAHSKRK
jgi:hypothetical protein